LIKAIDTLAKTSHMRMGLYRQQSPLWKATSANLIDRSKSTHSKNGYLTHHKIEKKEFVILTNI
jgi:hypothetical protein